ncbi:malonyl CoA-acyl carrier protein transacylase [Desulfosarcina ovata subsp. sediminis]|uniref:Malonyl CoA-acyl carrier protein transacylase n=1 Tax=Desulfosarcina ovata subsp. sediminis TaxID=885957 RepID=A0A5K7ZU49_9BACT|nr:ACP S-malonyltransferase [Desulfosarcina ovata]BBO83755.1 malonyl CoA-acyl carrier protein transacylase [Desulfosarcina ovata subsp. sediminis]
MEKIAFLFPGQGSQMVGMGQDLFQEYDFVREIFDAADDIAGAHISRYCFKGPMETLTETVNLQPAVTAVNLACLTAIQRAGIACDFSAGHSLGEYSALTAAQVVSMADSLRLVFRRGELMHREALKNKGAMSAVIGLDIDAVNALVEAGQDAGVVSVANHNSAKQIVITGAPEAVAAVSAEAKARGARAIPLKVSGAWHSDLIKGAEDEFSAFLDSIPFASPVHPVIHNVTADRCDDAETIRQIMARQLCSPVRWYDTVCRLCDEKVTVFVEVGPGKVLAGLLKKIVPTDYEHRIFNVNNMKTVETLISALS